MSEDYRNTKAAFSPSRFIVRILLKILWSIGGKGDAVDGLPRLWGTDIEPHLGLLEPGDFLLIGNNGVCSHCAVYIGDGTIVHSMATEKTMRGWTGSLYDALWRPWRWLRNQMDNTGVLRERLGDFFDRYERDTWIAVRRDGLEPAQITEGVTHIEGLVGKEYDYDFDHGDDAYYCTEIVIEFLDAALHPDHRPTFATKKVRVPGLLSTHVIEPVALLDADGLQVVAANAGARVRYAEHVEDATVVG